MAKLARADQWITSGSVRYRLLGNPSSPSGIEFGVDYAKAPVPDHYYVADYFFVESEGSHVLFTFGKLDSPHRGKLRSKIELYFSPSMFVRQLWGSSRGFHETLRKFVQDNGYHRAEGWEELLEAPKVQTFQSNQVMMVLSEGECVMDFFYISPKDIFLKPRRGEGIDLEPLVRIIMAPELLLGFLDKCEPLAKSLQSKFGDKNESVESDKAERR
ncbi:MAG: hypothetical protein L0Z50_18210 [Verrucomicrobiales bacterium]|nr:hypothetical protein [Verrucomicrobiales bacterium]